MHLDLFKSELNLKLDIMSSILYLYRDSPLSLFWSQVSWFGWLVD